MPRRVMAASVSAVSEPSTAAGEGKEGKEGRAHRECVCLAPQRVETCVDADAELPMGSKRCDARRHSGECGGSNAHAGARTLCPRSCGVCAPDRSIIDENGDFPDAPRRYVSCERTASECTVRTK